MNVSKLDVMRNADKDRETELCQTIIDACETLCQIAQERGDGEYEMYWSRMSGMALDGPPKTKGPGWPEAELQPHEREWPQVRQPHSIVRDLALDGPKTNDCLYPDFGVWRKLRWSIYNLAFSVFGKTRLWQRMGRAIWK